MGTVWDRATEFLSDNLSALLPLVLFAIFVPMAISQSLAPLSKTPGGVMVAVQLLSLALSIVSLWGRVAITALALDPAAGRRSAIDLANRRILPVILVSLALMLGLGILCLPFAIVLAVAGYDFAAAMSGAPAAIPAAAAGPLVLYFVVLCGFLLWIAARFALVLPVLVMEGGWFGALGRSFRLTRGITLKIIGVAILYLVVLLVSFLAAKLVFGAIFGLIAGGDGPVTLGSVLSAVVVSVVLALFTVLAAAFVGKLYLAARDSRAAIVESL